MADKEIPNRPYKHTVITSDDLLKSQCQIWDSMLDLKRQMNAIESQIKNGNNYLISYILAKENLEEEQESNSSPLPLNELYKKIYDRKDSSMKSTNYLVNKLIEEDESLLPINQLLKKMCLDHEESPRKRTNLEVHNLIEKDGPRNQHKAKIHTSSLPKESSNGPLLKQSHLASRNKGFYAHQSNQHIFNDSDGCSPATSHKTPLVTSDEENAHIGAENKGVDRSSRTPLSIARLRNCRTCYHNFVFSIFDDDDKKKVCLEIFEKSEEKKLLSLAIFISHDGIEITILILKKLKILVSDKPPTVNLKKSWQKLECFTFEQLPEKYWTKYEKVKIMVNLRKGLTPKIILHDWFGTIKMMENEDFDMLVYGIELSEKDGVVNIKYNNGIKFTESYERQVLNHFKQMKCACRKVETMLESTPNINFPFVALSNGTSIPNT